MLKEKLTKKYGNDYEKDNNKVRLNWIIPGGNVSLDIYEDVEVSISYSDNKATQNSIKELRKVYKRNKGDEGTGTIDMFSAQLER